MTTIRESRIAPLRKILDFSREFEYLECGHKHVTPRNQWGNIRLGSSRRCEKCRVVAANRFARAQAVYNNDNH